VRLKFAAHRLVLLFLGVYLLGASLAGAAQENELQRLRGLRRQTMRLRSLAAGKTTVPARFGLLVIPVDFVDARLPADWDNKELLSRLVPDSGEALHNYFRVASRERLDLAITLAPVVHLSEDRRQYSDRYSNGFTRTRRLATEAITAVRDLGLEFRRLDMDGPDGVAGTADDDGQVDGVLILHAGVGNENDAQDGLIQALQFFLDEPVLSQGISASFYAVASLHSGPGIWAHETAHLLGLEDRYDPLLHPAGGSEVQSVGGLGRFSLMSSGAWGTGGGYGAALPDAYSAWQMGWLPVRNLAGTGAGTDSLRAGMASRVWTQGAIGPEFFLLEARDPAATVPFDANVPRGHLLIYHIDERLPEGGWHQDGPQRWHLRVRLVEADGNGSLAAGQDDGSADDLFPGPLAVTDFGPETVPGTGSYYEGPSRIALTEIANSDGTVGFRVSLDTTPSVVFSYEFAGEGTSLPLSLVVRETGARLTALSCDMRAVAGNETGFFDGTGTQTIQFALTERTPGVWVPASPVGWVPGSEAGVDVWTRFEFRLGNGDETYALESRSWMWHSTGNSLDFRARWPGEWVVDHPDGNLDTTWHRWEGAPWLTADHRAVLACTGVSFGDPSGWPEVTYQNSAHTTLTSAPLGEDIAGVRMIHGIEVEMLNERTGMDGGVVVWVGPDGAEEPAIPLGGYPGRIDGKSVNPRHGQQAFVAATLGLDGNEVEWRTDTFPIPRIGPGPWRLRLVFAANSVWRARGWFVADIEPLPTGDGIVDFAATWDGDLVWTWPWAGLATIPFSVETRRDPGAQWVLVQSGDFAAGVSGSYRLDGSLIAGSLNGGARHRHELRVVGLRPSGMVASQATVVYPDGGDGRGEVLGAPWPNPAAGPIRFLLAVPAGHTATLRIFDARGRLVLSRNYAAGEQLVTWDGHNSTGARMAAGVYYLRLEGTGPILQRKVVLLH